MTKPLLLGLAAALLPILPAAAAPASADEAGRLAAVFERYVGRPGPGEAPRATVTPQGDDYAVRVDLARSLAGLDGLGFSMEPHAVALVLTPLPDGTWRVRGGDAAPLVMHLGTQTVTLSSKTSAFEGTFDPKLGSFSAFKQDQTGTREDRASPTFLQSRGYDAVATSGTGAPAAGGTVSSTAHSVGTGLGGTFTIKGPTPPPSADPAAPPPPANDTVLTFSAPKLASDAAVDRLDALKVLDLWAFLAAHPSREGVVAAQDELKALLRAGLPYLQNFKQNASADALSFLTPAGTVSARSVGASVELSELGGAGRAAFALSVVDLVAPSGQLPPWSSGLVPTALDLKFGVEGFHAQEAALAAVADVDLRKDVVITPEQKGEVGRLFWPGDGTVTLRPSRIATAMLDLAMDGHAALGAQPSGQLTVTAKGLEREIAALQAAAADDPSVQQILGPLVLAKNLAKPNADGGLAWVLDFSAGGPVLVNGAPLQ